jgi:hypothetical protein
MTAKPLYVYKKTKSGSSDYIAHYFIALLAIGAILIAGVYAFRVCGYDNFWTWGVYPFAIIIFGALWTGYYYANIKSVSVFEDRLVFDRYIFGEAAIDFNDIETIALRKFGAIGVKIKTAKKRFNATLPFIAANNVAAIVSAIKDRGTAYYLENELFIIEKRLSETDITKIVQSPNAIVYQSFERNFYDAIVVWFSVSLIASTLIAMAIAEIYANGYSVATLILLLCVSFFFAILQIFFYIERGAIFWKRLIIYRDRVEIIGAFAAKRIIKLDEIARVSGDQKILLKSGKTFRLAGEKSGDSPVLPNTSNFFAILRALIGV